MNLKDEIKPYTDYYGLISPWTDRSSGNGLLYSAEWIITLSDHNLLYDKEIPAWIKFYLNCEQRPGLFNRSPHKRDQNSVDDYVGISTAGFFLKANFAERILDYGRSKRHYFLLRYVYNNSNPGVFNLRAYFARFIALIAHIKICAGEKLSIVEKLGWMLSVLSATRSKHQDPWLLSYQLSRVMLLQKKHSYPILKFIASYFLNCVNRRHGYIGRVRGDNFNNKKHPLARYYGNMSNLRE